MRRSQIKDDNARIVKNPGIREVMRHGSFTAGCKERSKKTEEQEEMISLMMA
jgi:hypothetical protein